MQAIAQPDLGRILLDHARLGDGPTFAMPSFCGICATASNMGLAADRGAGARGAARRRRRRLGQGLAQARPLRSAPPAGARQPRHRLPRKDPREREAIALGHVGKPRPRDGRDHADRPHHRRSPPHRDRQPQHYERYRNKLGSAIGVSLHMGNWELAIWPFTLAGNNPAAVYRTVKNPYVDALSARPAPRPLSRRPARQGAHGRRHRGGRRRRRG